MNVNGGVHRDDGGNAGGDNTLLVERADVTCLFIVIRFLSIVLC